MRQLHLLAFGTDDAVTPDAVPVDGMSCITSYHSCSDAKEKELYSALPFSGS